jgi:hypothetical protein
LSNMKLDNVIRWAPVVQAVIGFLGLCSLGLVWWQIRRTNYWNRLNFLNNFIMSSGSIELERKVLSSTKALGIDLNTGPLTEAEVDKIWRTESDEAYYAIKEYLNAMETLCVGIRIGAADQELAYALLRVRIMSAHGLMEPFIKRMQEKNSEIYIELETVVRDFRKREGIEHGQLERRRKIRRWLSSKIHRAL